MSLVLRSDLLSAAGFRHGFSLRTGGVSQGAFESLNLGRSVGDDPTCVEENFKRLGAELSTPRIFEASQVHGAQVAQPQGQEELREFRQTQADALVALAPGIAVGVRTADCVPVLIGSEKSGGACAIHAGWRGLVGGVIKAAVQHLSCGESTHIAAFIAAVGPHIGPCCFEVGQEVVDQVLEVGASLQCVHRAFEKPHISLRQMATEQLLELGLAPTNIDQVEGCTFCDPARFFSYRRQGPRSGRHLSVICSEN